MKLKIKTTDGFQMVSIEDLVYIEANAPYTFIHCRNGQKIFCTQPLKEFDDKLNTNGFLRIHKSYLINVKAVERYKKNGETVVQMCSGQILKLARSKRKLFIEYFDKEFL